MKNATPPQAKSRFHQLTLNPEPLNFEPELQYLNVVFFLAAI